MTNRLLRIIIVVLCALLIAGPALAIQLPTRSIATEHFDIYYIPSMKSTATVIGSACEYWLTDVTKRLGVNEDLVQRVPVFIYRDQQDFSDATGFRKPGEAVGVASSLGSIKIEASGALAPPERVAGHEITHIVIFRILQGNTPSLPLWVNEGTAKYMTDDFNLGDRAVFADAVSKDALLPLSSLTTAFPRDNEGLAYAESTSAVNYFVKTYGEKSLAKLIHITGETGSFHTALKTVTGKTPTEFEKDWLKSEASTMIPPSVIQLATALGLAFFLIVAAMAYMSVRRHRNKIIEEEEESDDIPGPPWVHGNPAWPGGN